jgi:hypothetical protein
VGGEEVLGLPRGFEPLHLTLSSPLQVDAGGNESDRR